MYMGAAPIWEAWNSGGPFIDELRPSGRVMVDPEWQLTVSESAIHRGRGTWWRDDPSTLTDFAAASSWMVDSRRRNRARSFQRLRNGEWEYWGDTDSTAAEYINIPSGTMTRAALAYDLVDRADVARMIDPSVPFVPTYDGTMDYTDIAGVSTDHKSGIGRLTQIGVAEGYPDGSFKPNNIASDSDKAAWTTRLNDYLFGSPTIGQAGLELPNVSQITWDRSIDTDAAECTITIENITMKANQASQPDPDELGLPGYFTPNRGENPDSTARWPNHAITPWNGVLLPNAIVRTYEGYGGRDLSVRQAVAAGQLRQTGTWMIDRVAISSDGNIQIECRDMARLLIEQFLMEPVVPDIALLRYCRYLTLESGEKRSGNYFDYADIIYDLLIWAGFYYDAFPREELPDLGGGAPPDAGAAGFAQVHGVLETTGAYAEDCLPDDLFVNRPIIDAITEIRNIVGYLFWVDEEGAAHFQSPNWFQAGNFTEDQQHIDFVPEIDEKVNATGYSVSLSGNNIRTKIVIGSEAIPPVPPYGSSQEAYRAYRDAVSRSTFYTPTEGQELAHGMHLPAMWINGAFNDQEEQELMAELIAMHIHFRGRQGSVTMLGNPCISINDQVRIYERITSESYIHYVRGVSSSLDNKTGQYSMTLTTHWMGADDDWAGDKFGGTKEVRVVY